MAETPLISIVIPSYNQAKYIAANLDSILNQTFHDFEVIFIDDGSTDNTADILKEYAQKDSRIKYVYQQNSERAVARTHGISLARGKYVCLVDSDDTWLPEKLEKQLQCMEANPEIVLCYASVNRIDSDGNKLKSAARQQEGYSGDVYKHLLTRNFIPSVTPMLRRSVLEKVGAQVTEYIPYEDWDFWLRISLQGKFHHIKEPLGNYRIHPSQSVQNVKASRIEEVTIKILDAKQNVFPEAYSLAYLRSAYWYLCAGDYKASRENLRLSLKKNFVRIFDLRFLGLYLFSALSRLNKDLVSRFLGGFH